jgi:hypothetical protein
MDGCCGLVSLLFCGSLEIVQKTTAHVTKLDSWCDASLALARFITKQWQLSFCYCAKMPENRLLMNGIVSVRDEHIWKMAGI